MRCTLGFFIVAICAPVAWSQEISKELEPRLRAATAAIDANPRDAQAYRTRAAIFAAAEDHQRAIADYDHLLELDPNSAEAFDQRGSQHFMLGQITQSISDFDRSIQLQPQQEPGHWKRGISYYYAGRYDQGRRQFEGYQTVDDNDVENAVWRYLCMARAQGVAIARGNMLPIKRDARVPMMEVYALYGDAARAREHLATAAESHKIGHYMWNVADVHAKRLKGQGGKP